MVTPAEPGWAGAVWGFGFQLVLAFYFTLTLGVDSRWAKAKAKASDSLRWGQVQGWQVAVRQVHVQGPVVWTPVIPNPPSLGAGCFKPGMFWKPPDIWWLLWNLVVKDQLLAPASWIYVQASGHWSAQRLLPALGM